MRFPGAVKGWKFLRSNPSGPVFGSMTDRASDFVAIQVARRTPCNIWVRMVGDERLELPTSSV